MVNVVLLSDQHYYDGVASIITWTGTRQSLLCNMKRDESECIEFPEVPVTGSQDFTAGDTQYKASLNACTWDLV